MENVGESKLRNKDFQESFSRPQLIRSLIDVSVTAPVIFDVGGHKGESIHFLRSLFPDAIIHSVEPDPVSFQQLCSLGDERTFCHNLAFSDMDGTLVFFQNNISHTNSLYKVNFESRDSIYFDKVRKSERELEPEKFNREIKVAGCRMDQFCKGKSIDRINLLKIDVQGAEAKVLAGAGNLLERVDNIVLEVSFYDYYEHQSSFFEVEQFLVPFGFRLYSISDISNNPMNGRTDWVEVIYRKGGVK